MGASASVDRDLHGLLRFGPLWSALVRSEEAGRQLLHLGGADGLGALGAAREAPLRLPRLGAAPRASEPKGTKKGRERARAPIRGDEGKVISFQVLELSYCRCYRKMGWAEGFLAWRV